MSSGRAGPIAGILFVVMAVVGIFVIGGEPPDVSEDPVRETLAFYRENQDEVIIGGIMQTISATLLIFFGGSLRAVLREAEGPGGALSTVAFGGTLVLGTALALDATITFALADTIDKLQPAAAQALNALFNYDFLVFALGAQVFLLAAGISLIRHAALPKWVGWIAVVLGVITVTPLGFIALLGMLVLVLVMCVILLMRGSPTPHAA